MRDEVRKRQDEKVRAIWDAKIAADVAARGPMPESVRAALRARATARTIKRQKELLEAEAAARAERLRQRHLPQGDGC